MKHVPAALAFLLLIALTVMILGGISVALGYHARHGALSAVRLYGDRVVHDAPTIGS